RRPRAPPLAAKGRRAAAIRARAAAPEWFPLDAAAVRAPRLPAPPPRRASSPARIRPLGPARAARTRSVPRPDLRRAARSRAISVIVTWASWPHYILFG